MWVSVAPLMLSHCVHPQSIGAGTAPFTHQLVSVGWPSSMSPCSALLTIRYVVLLGCRTCYEVRCRPSTFTDGYGETLQREDACYDPTKTVVLTIADACPCHYPVSFLLAGGWCVP